MKNTLEMNRSEANYLVNVRSSKYVEQYGSIDKAIEVLEAENKVHDDLWSSYSCDCLGHAITCTRLMIGWLIKLKQDYNGKFRSRIKKAT